MNNNEGESLDDRGSPSFILLNRNLDKLEYPSFVWDKTRTKCFEAYRRDFENELWLLEFFVCINY